MLSKVFHYVRLNSDRVILNPKHPAGVKENPFPNQDRDGPELQVEIPTRLIFLKDTLLIPHAHPFRCALTAKLLGANDSNEPIGKCPNR
jgi:hypothetical protein